MYVMDVCVLASGSTGNAIYVAAGDTRLLIDAGISARTLTKSLAEIDVDPATLGAILVSHEHNDHVKGLGVLARKFAIPIHATEGTWRNLPAMVGDIPPEQRHIMGRGDTLEFGSLTVQTIPISHDAAEPVAFRVENADAALSIITDLGFASDRVKEAMAGADLLVLETNHDTEMLRLGKYPWSLKRRILGDKGHLSNVDAAYALCDVWDGKPMDVYMAHQSQENNLPELAELTVRSALNEVFRDDAENIRLFQTYPDRRTAVAALGYGAAARRMLLSKESSSS